MHTPIKFLSGAFVFVAILYGLISIVQACQILSTLSIGLSSNGIGVSFLHPSFMWLRIALFLLCLLQLMTSVYIARVGIGLFKGRVKGVRLASCISILLFPIGTIVGIFGLIITGCQPKIKL